MGANHKTTRASNLALQEYREACSREVQPDGSVGAPCWLCRQAIDYSAAWDDWTNRDRFERDHVKVVSKFPELQHDVSLWRPSHAGCNNDRKDKDPRPPLGEPSEPWT